MNFCQQVNAVKHYFSEHKTKSIEWRRSQLNALLIFLKENEDAIVDALHKDLKKPLQESWMTELSYLNHEIKHTLKQLNKWTKKRKVKTNLIAQPAYSFIQPEPLGTVLIIGAWNYPLQLTLSPLIAVIAAGNCAVIKPSELAVNTSNLLAKLLPNYIDESAIKVIEGGVEETTSLLNCQFDHIMYTGNGAVGKIVMTAAAKNLTPVTLELGGKSPVFVDSSADISISAKRIAWGKWLNSGQTCIAPDYILTTKNSVNPLVKHLKAQAQIMFGNDASTSNSYGRIINQRHCQRIADYLTDHNVVYGGQVDVEQKYIAPTIVLNPPLDSTLMTEEIFGPILPIVVVDDFSEAIKHINSHDKPLAAYLFTKDKTQENIWLSQISAGSIAINDVMMFSAVNELPFGGVGASGIGQYSGKAGFDNFSHLKAVIKRPFIQDLFIRFAPFSSLKLKILKWLR